MTQQETEHGRPLAGLDQLPRAIEPSRDLWPSIEARLEPRERVEAPVRRGWGLHAVAASVAVAFLAGILLGRQGPEAPAPAMPFMSLDSIAAPAVAAAIEASEREYQAAWKGFEPVGLAPSVLAQETIDELGRSWQAMKQAEIALLTALDEHPDNPFLAEKLLELRGQQLDFMRALHMLDQNSRSTT